MVFLPVSSLSWTELWVSIVSSCHAWSFWWVLWVSIVCSPDASLSWLVLWVSIVFSRDTRFFLTGAASFHCFLTWCFIFFNIFVIRMEFWFLLMFAVLLYRRGWWNEIVIWLFFLQYTILCRLLYRKGWWNKIIIWLFFLRYTII